MDINDLNFWEQIKNVTHFIFHWGGSPDHYQLANSIMPIIEFELKKEVFPNYKTTWHHDDKIRQSYLLSQNNFPVIPSWIFWDKIKALNWLKNEAVFPLVFKLKSSAGSKDVVIVKKLPLAKRITKKIFGHGIHLGKIPGNFKIKLLDFRIQKFIDKNIKKVYRYFKGRDVSYQWQKEKNYVLFQKFIPNNEYDTRVTIIGDRAFAFRRFNRKNDFRSSGSGKINYEIDKIDPNFLSLAFDISKKFGFQSMAYDFLWDENNNPVVCEMSYTYQDSAIFNCPGYWDSKLNWHEGHFWPQYFQLMDLLQNPDLLQPQFNV